MVIVDSLGMHKFCVFNLYSPITLLMLKHFNSMTQIFMGSLDTHDLVVSACQCDSCWGFTYRDNHNR